ncbi:hypothetical protein EG329_000925 [Mollisiaceae sp. DMI_Dod_QoI]|nr:hypothetical protein EG329_000925 [Helotiales sp. DMI_Dod_QoI]
MAFSRVAAVRSAIRSARPSVARPQCFRQVVRRGYASGHGSTQAGGDTLWAVGAIAVTVPTCWYLLSNAPEAAHGHGHGDSHGKEHGEEHGDEAEDDSKDEGEDTRASSDAEDKDSEKSEDSDSSDDEKQEADTPDTSDDESSDKESDDDGNTKKHISDAKGGAKKRIESDKSIKQGESETSGDEAAASKPAGGNNSQSGKQEGLTNTDTKHSTDIGNDPAKSKKSEGGPDTAKVKGTVDPKRPQPEKKLIDIDIEWRQAKLKTLAAHPHIKSLVTPQHTIIAPRTHHASQVMDTQAALGESPIGYEGTRLSAGVTTGQEDDDAIFNEWMVPFCQEPPGAGDIDTCCLGTWVPCVLYGKTDWRLHRVSQGEDPSNLEWESANGCNGRCWCWYSISFCFGPCFAGVLTTFQRTRIRGTYGIKGTVLQDCCWSFWLPACTQMQIDREVRAREGDMTLRYNKKYLTTRQCSPVDTQPLSPAPMSYTPHGPTSERMGDITEMSEMTSGSKKLQKLPPVIETRTGMAQIAAYAPQRTQIEEKETMARLKQLQQEQNKEISVVPGDKKAQTGSKKKDRGQKGNEEAQQLRSSPQTAVTDAEATHGPGMNTKSPDSRAKDKVSAIRDKSIHDRLSQQHPLIECIMVETEHKGKNNPEQENHALIDCTVVEAENKRSPSEHASSECTIIPMKSTGAMEQHRLTDCSGVSSSNSQELSYVHDFTDCPVDKAVLDYYENQERKAQQCSFADNIRGSSSSVGRSHRPYVQHTMDECTGSDQSYSSNMSRRDYRRASYTPDRTVTNFDGLKELRLASCPIVSHTTTGNNRPQCSEDSQATQRPAKKLKDSPNNFGNDSSTSSSNGTQGKDDTRQKQGLFKSLGKTNGTKTGSRSNDNKKGRSAEKAGQSAHPQVSSSRSEKKENTNCIHDDANGDVIGFPYSDVQEAKMITKNSAGHGTRSGDRGEIMESEQRNQGGTTPSFWSKMTGSMKTKGAPS